MKFFMPVVIEHDFQLIAFGSDDFAIAESLVINLSADYI